MDQRLENLFLFTSDTRATASPINAELQADLGRYRTFRSLNFLICRWHQSPALTLRLYKVDFCVARMARIFFKFLVARSHHIILIYEMPKSKFLKGRRRASRAAIPGIRTASAPRHTNKALARSV